jgi:hypothetical protein
MSRPSEVDLKMLTGLWGALTGRSTEDDRAHIRGWLGTCGHVSAEEMARLITRGYKDAEARGHRIGSLAHFDGAIAHAEMEAELLIARRVAICARFVASHCLGRGIRQEPDP